MLEKWGRRVISGILTICLVISALPFNVGAQDYDTQTPMEDGPGSIPEIVSYDDSASTESDNLDIEDDLSLGNVADEGDNEANNVDLLGDEEQNEENSEKAESEITHFPSIISQPQNIYCLQGENVLLNVAVSIDVEGRLSYQWYEGSTAIDAATESTFNPDTSTVGCRTYHCIVTNNVDGIEFSTPSDDATVVVEGNVADGAEQQSDEIDTYSDDASTEVEFVTNLVPFTGTYPTYYTAAQGDTFDREKNDYNVVLTDGQYKLRIDISDAAKEIQATNNLWYTVYYNSVLCNQYRGPRCCCRMDKKSIWWSDDIFISARRHTCPSGFPAVVASRWGGNG